eukprot:SAG31_NODE_3087_length_4690_cov_30.948377_6_plen_81_part_00
MPLYVPVGPDRVSFHHSEPRARRIPRGCQGASASTIVRARLQLLRSAALPTCVFALAEVVSLLLPLAANHWDWQGALWPN